MTSDRTPTVFVVDDEAVMRDSLRWLIESTGLRVETYGDAQTFLDTIRPEMPGCVILDVRMPGMSGLDLQTELTRRGIDLPTIVVTGHGEVPMAVQAVKAGALDFIEKPFSDQLLLDRVRQGIDLDARRRDARERRAEANRRLGLLTHREREVLERVVAGMANKEIAAALQLSPKTVEVHRAHVMEKMQASSVAELVRLSMLTQDQSDPAVHRTP